MKLAPLEPRKALNKVFLKKKPLRSEIEVFKTNLITLLGKISDIEKRPKDESEEHLKNDLRDFLRDTYYRDTNGINTKDKKDLVIHLSKSTDSEVGVIIEAKRPSNTGEMVTKDDPNKKALHELILYYLHERYEVGNFQLKQLVITNINEWYIIDANHFDKYIYNNTQIKKLYKTYKNDTKYNPFFYTEIKNIVCELDIEIPCVYFNIRDYDAILRNNKKEDDKELIALHKILSPEHLLKLSFANDSNSLDKNFYSEFLHIIGLTEIKDGSKKLIQRHKPQNRNSGSFIENTIEQLDSLDKLSRLQNARQFGETKEERLFNLAMELTITWVNRILFLKLLEAQLISYHKGDKSYSFLNSDLIRDYDNLNSLFFQVLAKKPSERNDRVKNEFEKVPYLNSSLFEPTELEHDTLFVSQLEDNVVLSLLSNTVIKDNQGKKQTGAKNPLAYLLSFLDAYDFASEGSEDIQEENKTLINASVLGLIFEKINGYKDGSFFTPSFITMYMCRETIRRATVQKFNETKNWKISNFEELYEKIEDRKEANTIINSLKICDPAVGSGHFLVSALNEIIAIKNDLRILQDHNGQRLKEYQFEVVNDELMVSDEDGIPFQYNPNKKESQRIQETLFHEKQTIIENCLFGVDINPNSVKICRLRLWIELLKNAYYRPNTNELETLPNIDINIKCGNSLVSRFGLDADLKEALKKSKLSIDTYKNAVNTYRNADSKEQKREMEELISEIKTNFRSEINANSKEIKDLKKDQNEYYTKYESAQLFEASLNKAQIKHKKELAENIKKKEDAIEEIKSNKIYENAFEWRFEFPDILNNEGDFVGFDTIIGNPPYGSIFNKHEKLLIIKNYFYNDYQLDIYMTFFELSERLVKENGKVCFIIPNTWLMNLKTPNIRKLLFTKFNSLLLRSFDIPVFDEAVVDTVIYLGEKSKIQKGDLLVEIIDSNNTISANSFDKSKLAIEFVNPFNIYLSEIASDIENKFRNFRKLSDVAKITQGTKPFQKGKGNPKQDASTMLEKPFVKDFKQDETFRPLLRGSLINKYSTIWNDNYYISFGDWLAEPRYSANFDADKKIVIRQTGSSIIATIDYKQFIARDNLYTLISENHSYNEELLLGILNSTFINWYYQNILNNEVGEALAQVKRGHLIAFPIPEISITHFDKIETNIHKILSLKSQDQKADISNLEQEIDFMVYELYGLTEEEIKIVKGS